MIIALLAGVALITFANRSPIHPGALSFLTRSEIENVECREGGSPDSVLDSPKPSRTKGMGLSGTFHCYRPVFRADERDPYIDRALEAENAHAKIIAQSVARRLDAKAPLTISVSGTDVEPELRDTIAAIYRSEIAALLGPGRIQHGSAGVELQIEIFRVDVPEWMSRARLKTSGARGEVRWLEL